MVPTIPAHRSRGARAMVMLHERELRAFVVTWRRAQAAGVRLPPTDDPSYESLEHLLRHVLRAARGYMTWVCEQLGLADPGIRATPEADALVGQLDAYLEHVCEAWRTPLADVSDVALEDRTYASRWGTEYCIDAMLEHAVMHPVRHAFQLEELTSTAASG